MLRKGRVAFVGLVVVDEPLQCLPQPVPLGLGLLGAGQQGAERGGCAVC